MIQSDPVCCIVAAGLLLLLPINWLLSAVTAAAVHETAHILSVFLFGGKIHRIRISVTGCVIECGELSEFAKLASVFMGPVFSLLLICFRRAAPQIAVCGLFQGVFNLLPILPLDGGRILQLLLLRFCPRHASAVMNILKCAFWLTVGFTLIRILWGS